MATSLTATTWSFTPYSTQTTIGATLAAQNAAFTAVLGGARNAAMVLTGAKHALVLGGAVTAGTFPAVAVAETTILGVDGAVRVVATGSLDLVATASLTQYVYVASDYSVAFGTSVPGSALAVLAVVVNNGGGTAFTSIGCGTFSIAETLNGNDLPTTTVKQSGTIALETVTWTYNADLNPLTATVVTAAGTVVTTWTYDGDGVLTGESQNKAAFHLTR